MEISLKKFWKALPIPQDKKKQNLLAGAWFAFLYLLINATPLLKPTYHAYGPVPRSPQELLTVLTEHPSAYRCFILGVLIFLFLYWKFCTAQKHKRKILFCLITLGVLLFSVPHALYFDCCYFIDSVNEARFDNYPLIGPLWRIIVFLSSLFCIL